MDTAIGIDLGTTFCCIGVYIDGKGVEIIPNKANDTTFPSIVTFTNDGILVCDQAVNQSVKEAKNTVYGVKRIIGLNYHDLSVQNDIKMWPFEVVKSNYNDNSMIKINRNGQEETFYPEEISAYVLKRLKSIAEEYLERTIKYAVITVPAYFTNNQREATKKAGKLAGLEVLRIINEPTAAALGYGLDKKYGKLNQTTILKDFLKLEEKNDQSEVLFDKDDGDIEEKNILVFDLGGGTFDVSLVNIKDNEKFGVKSTSGNMHLGGEDFDNKLVEYCIQEFCSKNKDIKEDQIRANKKGMKRLKLACEKSKRLLSITEEIFIEVDNFCDDETLQIKVTRPKFEDLCKELFRKLIRPIEEVMKTGNLDISDIREVVLVGGSTRIPKVKEIVSEYFGGIKINDSINPDEAVAYGAAIEAFKIHSKKKDIMNDIVLMDTIPFSLGLGVGDEFQLIIPKGSIIPTSVTNYGITEFDNQYSVELPIYEGEYNNVENNHFLGQFEINDIPMKKAGEIIFDVTYQVDVDGILTVSAQMKDDPSKKNWKVIKNDNIGLTEDELMKRNSMQNYDPKKYIEEFKENDNIKKKMKKLHTLYEKEIKFDKKMQYLKNFCKALSEFIDTFDTYSNNETVFEKYYLYLQGLFDSYNIYFSKLTKNEKDYEKEIITKIKKYFLKISILDIYYIKALVEKLIGIKEQKYEMFQEIIVLLMGILTEKGQKIQKENKKWSRYKAKNIFNEVLNLSITYLKEDDLLSLDDTSIYENWEKYMNECKKSIQIIKASTKIEIGNERENYVLYNKKPNENEEYLELVLDNFRDALRQLENEQEKFDLELEAIILANIAKIKYKYLNHNKKKTIMEEIQGICSESVRRAMSAANIYHKNIESTAWYKEIKNIDMEINEYFLIEDEKSSGGFKHQIKHDHREIFDELEQVFQKNNLEIIKFVLKKYPPKEYIQDPNKTIDMEWSENAKKTVYNLCCKYAPDNYRKETEEEKLNYTIVSEISTKLNSIYNEMK
mgnify:CR=1 FL=1